MTQQKTPQAAIHALGMRFGGLTAIHSIDLRVERGKITSLIGPNGAGKTTLFNCLSGIHPPTTGVIELAGADRRRRWSWRTTLACVAIGLIASLAGGALALNINGLWRAAIRRPNNFSDQPFSWQAALAGFAGYLRGGLAVERSSAGRWNIVSADGQLVLAAADDRLRADSLRDAYEQLLLAGPARQAVEYLGRQWRLQAREAAGIEVADVEHSPTFPTRAAAEQRQGQLAALHRRHLGQLRLAAISMIAGFILGSAGMASVWQRSRWTPEVVAAAGVARTFQNLRLFNKLTVAENVLVALEAARPRPAAKRRPATAEIRGWLDLVGLAPMADCPASQLAYGDRRRLEIARALALRPSLLLLDEPAAGMNAAERTRLKELIRRIRASGVTILLIEHEMALVMDISDHVVVLSGGSKLAEGTPEAVRANPAVIEAYLGAD